MTLSPYQHLYLTCDVIASQEAFSLRPSVVLRAKDRLIANLRDMARDVTTWSYAAPEVINVAQVKNVLGRRNYLDDMKLNIAIPVGFRYDVKDPRLSAYVEQMSEVLDHLITTYDMLYRQGLSVLSGYINDPDRLQEFPDPSATHAIDTLMSVTGSDASVTMLSEPFTMLSGYFTESRENEAPLSGVVGNYRQWTDAMERVNALNKKRLVELDPRKVAKQVKAIEALGTSLMKNMDRQKPRVENVQVAMTIIKAFAQWTHIYAVWTTMMIDLTTALKHNEKQILGR